MDATISFSSANSRWPKLKSVELNPSAPSRPAAAKNDSPARLNTGPRRDEVHFRGKSNAESNTAKAPVAAMDKAEKSSKVVSADMPAPTEGIRKGPAPVAPGNPFGKAAEKHASTTVFAKTSHTAASKRDANKSVSTSSGAAANAVTSAAVSALSSLVAGPAAMLSNVGGVFSKISAMATPVKGL